MTVWWFTTLKADQLDEVLEIEQASFQRPWNRQEFQAEFADRDVARYAVLSSGSRRLIGYLLVRVVASEMHLLKIAVTPRRRRGGVAVWALKQCFAKARRGGVRRMILEVRASNRKALGLYAKLGFNRIGIKHQYYSDTGEDALVMAKKLDS